MVFGMYSIATIATDFEPQVSIYRSRIAGIEQWVILAIAIAAIAPIATVANAMVSVKSLQLQNNFIRDCSDSSDYMKTGLKQLSAE